MKRFFTYVLITTLGYTFALAQDNGNTKNQQEQIDELLAQNEQLKADKKQLEYKEKQNRIWGKKKFTKLGYSSAETSVLNSTTDKGDFAFFMQKGTTFRLHSKPIGQVIRIGLDVIWFDTQFTKFQNVTDDGSGWTSDFDNDGVDDDSYYDSYDEEIQNMALTVGMGIGPNLSIAPFAAGLSKALQPLRITGYFHYSPSVALYMMKYDSDTEISAGFCNMYNVGCVLQYRGIGVGVEGRWGEGKFKPFDVDSLIGGSNESDNLGLDTKYTRRFANTRFFLQFTF